MKKLKFFRNIFLILSMPLILFGAECTTFTDIGSSQYKNDILYAANTDRKWVTCKEGVFEPTRETTRIEALKMALLAGGHNIPETTSECYDDIVEDWQMEYVCYAKINNIIDGSKDSFSPDRKVSWQEASKMILKSMTTESYSEATEPWGQEYFDKMSLYGFEHEPDDDEINRDYFVHILREIEKDPNKQPVAEEPKMNSITLSPTAIKVGDNISVNVSLNIPLTSGYSITSSYKKNDGSIGKDTLNCSDTTCSKSINIDKVGDNQPMVISLYKNDTRVDTSNKYYNVTEVSTPTPEPSINSASVLPSSVTIGENITTTANLSKALPNGYSVKVNYETSNSSQGKTLTCNDTTCSASITTDKIGANQGISFLLFNDQNQQLGTIIVKNYSVVDENEPAPTNISISSVQANPPSVKKGESITFIANLDSAISNGYSAYLKFTDAPTVSEKLMTCNGTECSLSREMNRVGENRPFRVNLKKDANVVSYEDGSYSVEKVEDNTDIPTCESYGSYDEISKVVAKPNEYKGTWGGGSYGYDVAYSQSLLTKYPNLPNHHAGIDIGTPNDTSLYSLVDGEVVKIGDPYGTTVYIRPTGQKGTLVYMHLSSVSISKGSVKIGELIGKSGNEGLVGNYHLHLNWLKDESNNPKAIWKGNQGSTDTITDVTYDLKDLKKCGDNDKLQWEYIKDINLPDGTEVQANTVENKQWSIKNSGSEDWVDFILKECDENGNNCQTTGTVNINSGLTDTIEANVNIPNTSGKYIRFFKIFKDENSEPIKNANGRDNFFLEVNIIGGDVVPNDDGEIYGIDVSKHNTVHGKNLKWKELKEKNIKFVFIKSTEGFPDNNYDDDLTNDLNKSEEINASHLDEEFEVHIKGALDNNLIVAPYHFVRPDYNNVLEDANKSVKYFISKIKSYYEDSSNKMLPPVIDVENPPSDKENKNNKDQIKNWTKAEFTTWLLIFSENIKKDIGIYPIFYMNENFANNEVNILDLKAKSSALWIAKFKCSATDLIDYSKSSCYNNPQLEPYNKPIIHNNTVGYKFWQFTETSTDYTDYMNSDYVDVNIFYGSLDDLNKLLVNPVNNYKIGNNIDIPDTLNPAIKKIVDATNKIKDSVINYFKPDRFVIDRFNPSILNAQDTSQTLDIYGTGFDENSKVAWDDGAGHSGVISEIGTTFIDENHIKISLKTLNDGVGTWKLKISNGDKDSEFKNIQVRDISNNGDEAIAYKNYIGVKTLPAGGKYVIDGIGWYRGECTSYVGYKVRTNGLPKFSNWYKGAHFGNAQDWGKAAKQLGWVVSDTPKAGTIGYWTSGKYGHVVYVDSVNPDGTVNISEYNVELKHKFNKATNVNATTYKYIYPPNQTQTRSLGTSSDNNLPLITDFDKVVLLVENLNNEILKLPNSSELLNELDGIYIILDELKKSIFDNNSTLLDNKDKIIENSDNVVNFFTQSNNENKENETISIPKGWSMISGNINLTKLPDTIRVVWIVDGGYLKGYSADKKLRDEISKRYELIETETLGSHKGIWIYAYEDTEIELIDNEPSNMKHVFWKGYSIHGANNKYISFINDDICKDGLKLIASGKLTADKLSVYVPEKVIDGFENFIDIEQNEAYYILCDDK